MTALKIVPYDPNDYKLSEALAFSNGETVENSDKISSVFSLYFQWPEHAQALVFVDTNKSDRLMAKIEYDQEERELTQLFVLIPLKDLGPRKFFENIFLRVEVFDNCFECECTLLEVFHEEENAVFIVEVPNAINVIKNRRLPRVEIPEEKRPTVFWNSTSGAGCENVELKIYSISMNSFVALSTSAIEGTGVIDFNGLEVQGKVVRKLDELVVVQLEHNDDEHVGKFFDFYRLFAYPGLVPRSEVLTDKMLSLFNETGYFKKYDAEKVKNEKEILEKNWGILNKNRHTLTADYVTTSSNQLKGASSNSYGYTDNKQETWVFHSLCSIKDESDFGQSKTLYQWRAEYNMASKSPKESIIWFASSSRWIERVYIRFILKKNHSSLHSVDLYNIEFEPKNHEISAHLKKFNDCDRYSIVKDGVSGGIGPEKLHIRNKLNFITYLGETDKSNEIQIIGEQLAFYAGKKTEFRISVGSKSQTKFNFEKEMPTDRIGVINKADLADFCISLDHCIEVTKKKYKK